MSKWFQWFILYRLTGSPLGALAILVVFWWTVDRFTFRFLPDPLQGVMRWRRADRLRLTLSQNPANRRARSELADILIQQRRWGAAKEVLEPNLAAGDRTAETLYLLGVAAKGLGKLDEAERLLLEARELQPEFRMNVLDLELGQVRVAKKDLKGAREALERYLAKRRASVKGRVLLAQVAAAEGDAARAKQLKDEAWSEYVTLPPYIRREERLWAWRAQPARPAMYAVAAVIIAAIFATYIAPNLSGGGGEVPPYADDE